MKHSSDIEERTSKQIAREKIKNDLIAAEKSIREEDTFHLSLVVEMNVRSVRHNVGAGPLAPHPAA